MRLPLFPLDVVLFPGALLPLHIFEPRYRTLLADCLAGDQRFGILLPGKDGAPPPTGVVGTVALIRATQSLPDGRQYIVVEGESRFMLRRYLQEETPYLLGRADPFDDDPADEEDAQAFVPELRSLGERCAAALRGLLGTPPVADWAADAGALSFQVAGLLDVDTGFKQRFLGIRSATERADILARRLPPIVADLEARAAVRARAAGNGKGGAHPDIAIQS